MLRRLHPARPALKNPARVIPLAFFLAIAVGAILLRTPWARAAPGEPVPLTTALFTACSATCVTGLTVVDTATYWSRFGQAVILILIQIGGFGIMTLATLVAMLVAGHVGLRRTLAVKAEAHALSIGDLTGVVRTIVVTMLAAEGLIAVLLAARFHITYDYPPLKALWHGLFHAVSAFNNAGFALYSDNLMGFAGDAAVLGPLMLLIVAGGIGFPVFHEIRVRWRRPRSWSVHTKLTMLGYFVLLALGAVGVALVEWRNPGTLGPMTTAEKLLNALFGGVTPRTAGFNTFDYGQAKTETWALCDALMFIGGGSAGTAGGVKVGTFVILATVIWSEIRGDQEVVVAGRTIPAETQRQAVAVALLGVAAVAVAVMTLTALTDLAFDRVLFETISAMGTVGLTNGTTEALPPSGKLVLIGLMFLGRVGTVTVASALALRHRHRACRFPDERPIIG